jgi:phosphoglucomutase
VATIPFDRARVAPTTHKHDYLDAYVRDLVSVVDLDAIRASKVRIGVDPLGGASVAYWDAIGERYDLDLEVVNRAVDPKFGFMTVDWDGQIRMDPSSPYAMARMVDLKDRFDVAFASDTDADRHGVVTRSAGLLAPNHYLAVAIGYLFANRPEWPASAAVGKTVVSSSMIIGGGASAGRLIELPVGSSGSSRDSSKERSACSEELGRDVPPARRHRLDDGQGRARPELARRRDRGADREGPR